MTTLIPQVRGNRVTEHSGLGEIDQLSWSQLTARPPASVLGSPAWLEAAFASTHSAMEPLLLVCEGEGGLTGLLPLALDDTRAAQLVGAPYNDLSDVLTLPGHEREAARAILAAVRSLVDRGVAVKLHSLDPQGVLAAADAEFGVLKWSLERPAPTIQLDSNLEAKVSGRRRRTWGNRRRRLEQDHAVEFKAIRGTAVVDALAGFERLREWRRLATERPPERPPVALVAEAVRRSAATGAIAFFQMLVDDSPVACDLYLLDRPVALMWLRGLDPAWQAFPCGHLLLCWTGAFLRCEGFQVLDMGRGDEPYKFTFGASRRVLLRAESLT